MDTVKNCQHCGKPLSGKNIRGLCPECMLKVGLGTSLGPAGAEKKRFAAPSAEEVAKLFPQLQIIQVLGQGGMGAVYKARQPVLDRLVALKILPPEAGGDADFAERFTREARALARLNHPNIVAMYEFGAVGGLHFFIMEYVDGMNLRQLEQAGKLSSRDALSIIPQICEALQFAHDEGIVHRDIKPENVLLDKKGRVKIADFGLAKILGREPEALRLTRAKDLMGTPHYMAPEQVEHPQTVDHRADIYSLGVVFYEMLTGELPLGKFQPPSRKVQVDLRLDEVVMHALEKEPERRYQHASEVKSDVETIVTSSATAPAKASVLASRSIRQKISPRMLAVAIIILALAGLMGWAVVNGLSSSRIAGFDTSDSRRPVVDSESPVASKQSGKAAKSIPIPEVPPVVVRTVPQAGLSNVDPALTEIRVTFSKEMMTNRMWAFCKVSEDTAPRSNGEPHYLEDQRTCVLPVKLEPGKTYALWFNRDEQDNFRDTLNQPSVPYLLIFETQK
jgi:serine/threonine protein kinase